MRPRGRRRPTALHHNAPVRQLGWKYGTDPQVEQGLSRGSDRCIVSRVRD